MRPDRTHPVGAAMLAAVAASMLSPTAGGAAVSPTAESAVVAQAPPRGQQRPTRRDSEERRREESQFTAEQTHRETRVVPVGANGLLELRTVVGDISVIPGPGKDAHVEIVRRSRGRTDADAKLGLERVVAGVERAGDRAAVIAVYPSNRRGPFHVSVSYAVTVPAGTRIAASSISGNITIRNVKGDVDALVTSGSITISGAKRVSSAKSIAGNVTLTDITTDESITAGSMTGDIILDRVKARRLDLEATAGNVNARDVECQTADVTTLNGSIDYAGRLAENGNYVLKAHAGNVRVSIAGKTGFELRATTFSGEIRPAPGLTLQGVGKGRGSLRGTVGDGRASLVVTTFSGNIDVGR